jgi:hypothetical protein
MGEEKSKYQSWTAIFLSLFIETRKRAGARSSFYFWTGNPEEKKDWHHIIYLISLLFIKKIGKY